MSVTTTVNGRRFQTINNPKVNKVNVSQSISIGKGVVYSKLSSLKSPISITNTTGSSTLSVAVNGRTVSISSSQIAVGSVSENISFKLRGLDGLIELWNIILNNNSNIPANALLSAIDSTPLLSAIDGSYLTSASLANA